MFRVFVGRRSCGSHGAVLFRLVVQLLSLGGGLPQVLLLLHVCVVTAAARGGDLTVALRAVTLSLNEFLKVVVKIVSLHLVPFGLLTLLFSTSESAEEAAAAEATELFWVVVGVVLLAA